MFFKMKNLHKALINTALLVVFFICEAQDLPPVITYTPEQYNADNQNWSLSQSSDKKMFVANNKGLLEFNGANWQFYASPNESIIRSVKVVEDKIYTGCYMDFGYWERGDDGILKYTSLAKDMDIPLIEDEQFWNILNFEEWILFQSLNRIYIYNQESKTFKFIESKTKLTKAFLTDDRIFFQKLSDGLYLLENGKEKLFLNDEAIREDPIVEIYNHQNKLLVVTQNNGLFFEEDGSLVKWNIDADKLLNKTSIYSSVKLTNGDYALGTISHGIIVIKPDGKISFIIDQQKGLSNNTVLSLFEDMDQNIWLGLDNGINCVNLASPLRIYKDVIGELGTVYASAVMDDIIYLGTNQGLFYKRINSDESFKPINDLKGQVWNLIKIDNQLFCGHDIGTFIVDKDTVEKISSVHGTWNIIRVPNNNNLLLQGNYLGLHVIENTDGKWKYRNKIEGFNMSSRYFEFLDDITVFVSHEYKGVYKIELNESLTKAKNVFKEPSVEKGLHSSLIKYNGNILYTQQKGIFRYDQSQMKFEKDPKLNDVFNKETFTSGKLVLDKESDIIWGFSKDNIIYITQGNLSGIPKAHKIYLPDFLRNSITGYENITKLNNDNYLMGCSDGYLVIRLDKEFEKSFEVSINSISSKEIDTELKQESLISKLILKNQENNIEIHFSAIEFNKFSEIKYQYRLKGLYNEWSAWSADASVFFKNLPHGDYTFEVRARIGDSISKNTATFDFKIQKPWYLSNIMIVFYALGLLSIYILIHTLYKSYYRKQREKLLIKKERELELKEMENKQQAMKFKNEQLQLNIKNKNRELAISTMSLIKKNEFLNNIKDKLKRDNNNENTRSVIKLINKNLNNTDDWKFFEEAFNNADKDFLKKIKSTHPELTPNDLRLCAYLRLNLSSKEIAPLLNISPKSVEVKRYRLRKKMNLNHETSLTNYILEI